MSRLPSQEGKGQETSTEHPLCSRPCTYLVFFNQNHSSGSRNVVTESQARPVAAGHQLCNFRRVSELIELSGVVEMFCISLSRMVATMYSC